MPFILPNNTTRQVAQVLSLGLSVASCLMPSLLTADILYGGARTGSNGNAIWEINTNTMTATPLVTGLAAAPNSLATHHTQDLLYFGSNTGLDVYYLDLSDNTVTHLYDIATSNPGLVTGLTSPSLSEGGAFYNGNYYTMISRSQDGGAGAGNSILRFNLSADGKSVTSVDNLTIGPLFDPSPSPGGTADDIGDLGDFVIFKDTGQVFGSSKDAEDSSMGTGAVRQIGGYWSFNLSDTENTFNVVSDTSELGSSQPIYQLAIGADGSTLYGLNLATPTRLDTIDPDTAAVTAGSDITGFDGTQFTDLSDAVPVSAPEPGTLSFLAIGGLLWFRKRLRGAASWMLRRCTA